MIWKLKQNPSEKFLEEFKEYGETAAKLFWNRGLKTKEEIDSFLNSDYETGLKDPFLFLGMSEAVNRLNKAVEEKEKIIVYGDYDADGITASVILYEVLKKLEVDFEVYIPNRFKEGYGLSDISVGEIIRRKANLVITVDCGITDVDEVAELKKNSIATIIIDHHLVPQEIPSAFAIINPKQKNDTYPFKEFSGAGLAFKFAQALVKTNKEKFLPGWEKWLLDLAAIAAIADMVPLLNENRVLVKYGLFVLSKTRRFGLAALMKASGIEIGSKLDTQDVSFIIAPRINAPSRMGYTNTSFELLISEFKEESDFLSKKLIEKNKERQDFVDKIFLEIDEKLKKLDKIPNLIFEGGEWPGGSGVVGIVASRLKEKYNRPVYVYAVEEGRCKGSFRGIESFNVVEAMKNCSDVLIEFGGHAMAGGCAFKFEDGEKFKNCLLEIAGRLAESDLTPVLEIDAESDFNAFNVNFYGVLEKFEPFGVGNFKPLFLIRGVKVKNFRLVGNGEKHLKMTLEKNNKIMDAIAFAMADFAKDLKIGENIDIVCELDKNEWNGSIKLQLKIKDIKISI